MADRKEVAEWGLALLPIRPWTLPRLAAESSTRCTLLAGSCWAFLLFGFLFSIEVTAASEPFPTLGTYLGSAIDSTLICGLFFLPFALPIAIYFAVLAATSASSRSPMRVRALCRRLLVTHMALALPLVGWGVLRALHLAADPQFGLFDQVKPDWIHSPLLAAAGSPWWLLPLAFAYFWIALRFTGSGMVEKLSRSSPRGGSPRG